MRKRYSYREHLVDPRGADPRADMQLLDLEISKLRSTLVQLRIADSDKMKIFAQMKQLQNEYQFGLNQQQTAVNQCQAKLNIDNQSLNNLTLQIGFLKDKLQCLNRIIAELEAEALGIEKAISQKLQIELPNIRSRLMDGQSINQGIHLEKGQLESKSHAETEESIRLGREEQNLRRSLADNLGNLKVLEQLLLQAEGQICKMKSQARLIEDENENMKQFNRVNNKNTVIVKLERHLGQQTVKCQEIRNRLAAHEELVKDNQAEFRRSLFKLEAEVDRGHQLATQLKRLEDSLSEKEMQLMEVRQRRHRKLRSLEQMKQKHSTLLCEMQMSSSVLLDSSMVNRELVNQLELMLKNDHEVRCQLQRRMQLRRNKIQNFEKQFGLVAPRHIEP